MNRDFIVAHWYAHVYAQQENQTNDVDFLLRLLEERTDGHPQNILEAACGGGRICVPLAQAGHTVTGFDASEAMLLHCYRRMAGLPNLRCYKADATDEDWGTGYDVVVLGGNVLINIETALDYATAQAIFLHKAGQALRKGGHLFLDFDLHANPKAFFHRLSEGHSHFEGTDDLGTFGRTVGYGGVYDPVTQIANGASHIEITQNNGESWFFSVLRYKHIPTLGQVHGWLQDAGLSVEASFANYTDKPVSEPLDADTYRATLWARKD